MFILVYVDDLIVTGDSSSMINSFVAALADRFSIKDLGQLTCLLGVEVIPNPQVNKLSQYMRMPTTDHWHFVKRLLRYLCGTINDGLQIHWQSPLQLHAFSDADWAGDKDDFSSTSAYIIYLGRNPISWSSKK
ncbi:hypothetical protein SADUNF_Sadunf08G0163100 [Salix dunnii]|uniref:Reverse transcriptase Ty1/copia-type domain-containing protein n=1 Tax=Salix dunnii TaxID=1413687 RepID=A0A835JXQ5_9ROSI|nr:hypothetical protein SADUNF_Sadunf08G0163100 [Salix dunnii]